MSDGPHVGDIGTTFRATVRDQDGVIVDISTATTKQLIFRRPDRSTLAKAASFTTTGTDGQLEYTTLSGDLTVPGSWDLQGYVILGTNQWHTDIEPFTVFPNLG